MNKPNNPSESVKKLNPHLFGSTNVSMISEMRKPMIKQRSKPLLNNLETEFLDELKNIGWKVILCQAVKLRLCNGVWYTPDFITAHCDIDDSPLVAWEVKGPHVWEDSIIKMKVAAGQYSFGQWRLAHKDSRGLWEYQIVT